MKQASFHIRKTFLGILTGVLLLSNVCASIGFAEELQAGKFKMIRSKEWPLWEKIYSGDDVISDFIQKEVGKPLEIIAKLPPALLSPSIDVDAPCRLTWLESKHGDEMVRAENGLISITILPAYGGRIIEFKNKITNKNVFLDNYQSSSSPPEPDRDNQAPHLFGGWIEGPDNSNTSYWNTPHRIDILADNAEHIIIKTTGRIATSSWGVRGDVAVERWIKIERGNALLFLDIALTNHSGESEREFRFRPHVRFSIGEDPADDEFWLSSLGYVTTVPSNHRGDCYNTIRCEDGIDTWQAIIDKKEREGVAILPAGEIDGRMCIYGSEDDSLFHDRWYTYENTSTLREHAIEGSRISVTHDMAPILNFDAVTFATREVAVEFVPEKVHFAPGENVSVLVGAAYLKAAKARTLKLHPSLEKNGVEIETLEPIEIATATLIAAPRLIQIHIPESMPFGSYDLVTQVLGQGKFKYRVYVSDRQGIFLRTFSPVDSGFGKGVSNLGHLTNATVKVNTSNAQVCTGSYEINGAELAWKTSFATQNEVFLITHVVDFSNFPVDMCLQSMGMYIPLRVGTDVSQIEVGGAQRLRHEYQKYLVVTVGSHDRDEQWFVDQARGGREQDYSEPIPAWALSDTADRFPIWRIGGILQKDHSTSWIWKASDYDVAPIVLVQDQQSQGWMDVYSRLIDQGLMVFLPSMRTHSPREILFDGEAGAFIVFFFPPHVRPIRISGDTLDGNPSQATVWGVHDRKIEFNLYIRSHLEDLTGWLPNSHNQAKEIRKMVNNLK